LVESITEATVVQSKASEAVTQTMTNVAASANKTSKEASLVSSSFEQLRKVAQTLQEDVGQFKVS
jgi:methyl-accepting chemotaxis protein